MSNRKSHTYPKPDALTETVGRLLALGIVRLRLKQDRGRNQCTAKGFVASYALAKIRRYSDICNRDRSQSKFLLGWINRSLSGLKQWT